MSSLNEGFELDEGLEADSGSLAETIFSEIVPGEVPDLDSDVTLVAMSDRVHDLDYLQQDIRKANGMNQTFALEANRLMPGFLSDQRPLGFFTQLPTRTQFTVSLEAIEEEKKSLLQRLLLAVKALFQKVVAWLKDLLAKLMDRVTTSEAAEVYKDPKGRLKAYLATVQKAYDNPAKTSKQVGDMLREASPEDIRAYVNHLQDRLMAGDDRLDELYRRINASPELHAMATGSTALSKLLLVAETAFQASEGFVAFDLAQAEKLIHSHKDPMTARVQAASLKRQLRQLARIHEVQSLDEFAQATKLVFSQRDVEVTREKYPLVKLLENFAEVMKHRQINIYMDKLKRSYDMLLALQKQLDELLTRMPWPSTREAQQAPIHPLVNEVFRVYYAETRGLMQVCVMSAQVVSQWVAMARALNALATSFASRVKVHVATLPEEDQKIIAEFFQTNVQHLKESPYSF